MARLKQPAQNKLQNMPDPLGREQIKSMAIRLGLILLAVWLVGGLISGVVTSTTGIAVALGIPGAITLLLAGVVLWMVRQAKKAIAYGSETDLETAMILAIEAYNATVVTEDRLEGVRAFNEKRRPQYKGR